MVPADAQKVLFRTDSGNKIIGEFLKTNGETPSNCVPVPPHIRFAKKVEHVLLPLFPIFGIQQIVPDMVFGDGNFGGRGRRGRVK